MAKRTGLIARSLLDPTRINDPHIVAEYDEVKAKQRKSAKPAELAELMKALKRVEADLSKTPRSQRARFDSFKKKKREAETAIKNWQFLNGFR
jgi:hypothetical protein